MIRLGMAYVALGISLVSVAASQLLIKSRFEALGIGATADRGIAATMVAIMGDFGTWCAALLVASGALLWYFALSRLPVHVMLPLAALIGPLTSAGAYFFLGEPVTAPKMAAIALIATGAAWLASLQG